MTILSRAVRDLLERLLGTFSEGPEPPPRLADEVRLFRALATRAPTEEEWEEFACRLAERAYRDGYVRGLHWLERCWDGPTKDPEKVLEEEAHQRSLRDDPRWAGVLDRPLRVRELAEAEAKVAAAARAGLHVYRKPL